jgi:hypothetical protein
LDLPLVCFSARAARFSLRISKRVLAAVEVVEEEGVAGVEEEEEEGGGGLGRTGEDALFGRLRVGC